MNSIWTSRNILSCYEPIDLSISQENFFYISKCLACNAEKTLRLKITKKNKYRKICIYVNIYPVRYDIYIMRGENNSK